MATTHEGALLDNDVLQQRVEAALRRGGADFQSMRAHASGGTVTLTGSVATAEARSRAEGIVLGVYGVKGVQDKVRVAGERP